MYESSTTGLKKGADVDMPQSPSSPKEEHSLWKQTKTAVETPQKAVKEVVEKAAGKVTKAVVQWVFHQPLVLKPREHPAWPGYTGIGTKLDFKLQTQVYDSRTLVDNTVASFFPTKGDRNLTPTQLAARGKIIQLFSHLKNSAEPIGTPELRRFTQLFDQFFFAGSMANRGRPRVFVRVWTREAGIDNYVRRCARPSLTSPWPWGFARDRRVRGYGPLAEIHIAGASFYLDPVPLWFLVQTLLHEMVHAYLNLFLCRCPTCLRDYLNTFGIAGHGTTFLMLMDCVDQTLRTWGVGVTGVLNGNFSIPCCAGSACPEAWMHDEKGRRLMWYDEIYNLRTQEKWLIKRSGPSCDGQPPSDQVEERIEEKRFLEEEDTDVGNDKMKVNPEEEYTEANSLRPVNHREPGVHVYMTDEHAGSTRIDQAELSRAGDVVQKLIAEAAAESAKNWPTKFNLRWPRIGEKNKARERDVIREKDFFQEKDMSQESWD